MWPKHTKQSSTAPLAAFLTAVCGLLFSTSLLALDFVSDLPSGQPVGTTVEWSIDTPDPGFDYRLSVSKWGSPPRVVYDFSDLSRWEWTPLEDGIYRVEASVREIATGSVTPLVNLFVVSARVVATPVVTATDNALVALYSAPPCAADLYMRATFYSFSPRRLYATDYKPCNARHSMNYYLAGMLPARTYYVSHEVRNAQGVLVSRGPVLLHRTGSVPVTLPVNAVTQPPALSASLVESIVLFAPINFADTSLAQIPYATDLSGQTVWYYDRRPELKPQVWRPNAGGTILTGEDKDDLTGQALREIDLAGHTVRWTTAKRISEQVEALGHAPVTSIHHEAVRLPDGSTAVLGSAERIYHDIQGVTGPVDILGDYVIVLDQDFQVSWVWDAFEHLDLNRTAILGEVCGNVPPANAGCPPIFLVDGTTTFAKDWTHSNSINYSPTDGDLIVSMRHQDWVIKINYDNGAGDGSVQWRLGPNGDFTIDSTDPFPWNSHQHDAKYVAGDRIVIYDNSNTRCENGRVVGCNSRGQVYQLDETNMTATLEVNADLGHFALAVGSAQKLVNGAYHFNSGVFVAGPPTPGPIPLAISQEVLADGSPVFQIDIAQAAYRSFRLIDLYQGTADADPPF